MQHDLIHIQGKAYVLVPLHEYRRLVSGEDGDTDSLPDSLKDQLVAGQGNAVKIIRKFRGLTQEDLAKSAQISRPYLAEIETGRKQGSIAALKLLAEALQVPAGLLLEYSPATET